jgi:oligopeptide/dipeptide ABC transporter ATP-binding protein
MQHELRVRGLRIWLPGPQGPVAIVDGVDFDLKPGEVLGIAGESGSGKTLSSLSLLGLLPANAVTEGEALFDGRNLLALSQRELESVRGKEIAMIFQNPTTSLHPMLSVGRQLTEHVQHHLHMDSRAAHRHALRLLEEVRIPSPERALEAFPHQFSGGMQQRIAIAIALACGPKIIVADEPTTALDVTIQAGILRLLDRLCRQENLGLIIITHDIGVLSAIADRLLVLYAGRAAEYGPASALLGHPRHPYTAALLAALPQGGAAQPLTPIPGAPTSPAARPPGCAFHPRCQYAQVECASVVPPALDVGGGRWVACPVDPLRLAS